jgi:uncharacterized protein YyaL (SSP411 family)
MKASPLSRFASLVACAAFAASTLLAAGDIQSEPSAFLRQYAGSQVNWMTWGDAAFARAKAEQKPIFLTIGLFTSELSRAMNKQTFSNEGVAKFLNDNFVCVIVDAKEQPELTVYFQSYVESSKQMRGLPLNIWLTPELKPFEGANYLPPTEEWGKEGFMTVAKKTAAAWTADAAAQRTKADDAVAALAASQQGPAPAAVDDAATGELLTTSTEAWRARFDATNGGFGEAPKYVEPELLRYLLNDPAAREMALLTLRKVVDSGTRDQLDHGIFRYSIDLEWRVPYFQKLLADQARLVLALLDAARISGDQKFATAARQTLDYAITRLHAEDGDFRSAEDATAETAAAAYFWTAAEITDILGKTNAAEFSAAYGVKPAGNVSADAFPGVTMTGKNALIRTVETDTPTLIESRQKLLAARQKRSPTVLDDGATSGAHGLMLTALSRAGAELKEPRYAKLAAAEFNFLKSKLRTADASAWLRVADRTVLAGPEDYALIAQGLLAYQAATKDAAARELALKTIDDSVKTFFVSSSGRIHAVREKTPPAVWFRVRPVTPGAGESPSAEATLVLLLAKEAADYSVASEVLKPLLAAISEDVRNAPESPRGDLLLALQAAHSKK